MLSDLIQKQSITMPKNRSLLVKHLLEEDLVISRQTEGDLEGHSSVHRGRSAVDRQGIGGGLGRNAILAGVLRRGKVHGTTEVNNTNKNQR